MPKVQLPVEVGVNSNSLPESGFPLVPDAENGHPIDVLAISIERHISGAAARNHQFPYVVGDEPANKRMLVEDGEAAPDDLRCGRGSSWIGLEQEPREPIEILQGRG